MGALSNMTERSMPMSTSEVAQLRRRIELECEAMQQAMTGLAVGVSFHRFIYMRMQSIRSYQECLAGYVGEDEANNIVGELYYAVMEGEVCAPDREESSS
jgi:hypothetical protein